MSTAKPISSKIGSDDLTNRQAHFAGTSVLAARGSIYQQYSWFLAGVIMLTLRCQDCLASPEPIHGDFIVRIGEARPGLTGHRRFSGVAICIPSRIHDRVKFALQGFENGIDKAATITLFKFFPGQFYGGHSLADIDLGQRRDL